MTDETAPTAPGMVGLPADTAPVTRRPPSRPRRRGGRAVLAGGLAALALGGTVGALGPLLGAAEAPSPGVAQVTSVRPGGTTPPVTQGVQTSDDRGEQD